MVGLMMAAALAAGGGEPVCHGARLAAAVQRYAQLSRAMNAPGVGAMYADDGVLIGANGAPITGPGEVERFLGGFGAYKLADYSMTVAATIAVRKGWRTEGRFDQHGTDPAGTAFVASGRFTADWRCTARGWRVARMATAPGG